MLKKRAASHVRILPAHEKAARERLTEREQVKAYTVAEFCRVYRVSKAVFYRLRNQGLGPRTYRIGRREYIACEDAAAWQQQMVNGNPHDE